MKTLVNKILDSTSDFKRSSYNMDDIEIPDDDVANDALMKSLIFTPKNKKALKKWILEKLITDGPNADLSCVDLTSIHDMSFLFSYIPYTKSKNVDMHLYELDSMLEYFSEGELAKISDGHIDQYWFVSREFNFLEYYSSTTALYNLIRLANPDISGWDVSGVTDMRAMFAGDKAFNCDISGWNVSNVKHMDWMFAYGQLQKAPWKISPSTTTDNMFMHCS